MVMTDPVADLLTRVRNAARAGHKQVTVNHSK
ncbi:30S ribosomal protein S8, partial [bacterium]|nr:30S ribosomal protein S8 [bacterium]